MRKFLLIVLCVPMTLLAQSPARTIAKAGSFETVEELISPSGNEGYGFQQMVRNGHYEMGRVLDYDSLEMAFLGNWPLGVSYSLAYSGVENVFLLGSGGAVKVIDANDPENPQELSVVYSRSLVDAICFDPTTSRLYLGAYFSGVEIWDMSDMTNPFRLARIPTNSYPRGGVFAEGNYLYVMSVADGIYIYDLSDLNNIQMTGHFPIPSSTLIWTSAKDGDLMFCAANNSCRIVDVSDPANPQLVGVVSGATSGVAAAGGKLYQVMSSYGLKIWDVNNPASPQLLGQIQLDGNPARIALQGNYAFVSNSTTNPGGGVRIVNISDPANPQEVSAYSGIADYVAVSGNVVAAVHSSEAYLLSIDDINNPFLTAEIQLPSWVHDVCVNGNLAYVGSNGFRVFDITDKSHPTEIGYNETLSDLVAVSGNLAVYIPKSMGGNNPVNIMDISDPASPFKRGHYTAPAMTYDIVLRDHYAIVACWWDGFRIIDFSDPDAPTLTAHGFGWYNGAIPGEEYCFVQALDIEGNYLYLIDYQPFEDEDTKGLYIFDISDIENPVFISRFATLNAKGQDVSVQNGFAYVADDLGGMEVIDVNDPLNPFIAGYVYLPDAAKAVDVEGDYAYLANYIFGGVEMIDISFPANPILAGYYKPSGVFALGVNVDGSNAYIADGIGGFQIYDNLIITDIQNPEYKADVQLDVSPNPAGSVAVIQVQNNRKIWCKLSVQDITGKIIMTFDENVLEPGNHSMQWNGREESGNQVKSGMYIVRLQTNEQTFVRKLLWLP